jgi:mannobiose 2-epimerase
MKITNEFLQILGGFCLLAGVVSCKTSVNSENQRIAAEMEKSLKTELLDVFYPRSLDTVNGGFLSDFTYDWQPGFPQNKMIVAQARHVWTSSNAAMFFNDDKYKKVAEHGYSFLRDKMWDNKYGGFYMIRNREGGPLGPASADGKTAYGNAFAIYALTSYFRLTGDSSALELARQTFLWLEQHSHDPVYGGYFNNLTREGNLSEKDNKSVARFDRSAPDGKDQNSSIHLLEAFTELYKVWPDSIVHRRVKEMLELIRDKIVKDKGYLTLFMERDWTPISYLDSADDIRKANFSMDHVSFGHDIETAYLMLEASQAIESGYDKKTLETAKKLVDHSIENGWDNSKGGLYNEGYWFKGSDSITVIDNSKVWWAQAEALNSLLLFSKLYPDEKKYYQDFQKQWEYMKTWLIDHEYGGWYYDGIDNNPESKKVNKTSDWKVNYHESRSLMNCIEMLTNEKRRE